MGAVFIHARRHRGHDWPGRLAAAVVDRGVAVVQKRDDPAVTAIDAEGDLPATPWARRLVLMADGGPGFGAILRAVLSGHVPALEVREGATGALLGAALPAVEDWRSADAALRFVLARAADLVAAVAAEQPPAAPAPDTAARSAGWRAGLVRVPGLRALAFGGLSLADRIAARVDRLIKGTLRWRIGWRPIGDDRLDGATPDPSARWRWLPDAPDIYYADPFPLVLEGTLHLFFEAFPAATGKGVIAHCVIGADGAPGPIAVVLEEATHLSYPQVFIHGGRVVMIPESAAAGEVALYVADPFPTHWTKARTLIDDVTASDATVAIDEATGRTWLMAALGGVGRSNWDALGLWSAPDLHGPYRPHPRNPVLIDASSARPAGPLSRDRAGRLLRPVQDCRQGYGAALAFARIDAMDDGPYRQTIVHGVRPPAALGARGLHHHAIAGGYEFVDMLMAGDGSPARPIEAMTSSAVDSDKAIGRS